MRRRRDETAKLFRTTTSTAGEATPRPTTWALPMALDCRKPLCTCQPVSRGKATPYGQAFPRWPVLEECAAALLLRLSSCALVGRVGVEPTTSRLSGVRSNHLSYRPKRAARQYESRTGPHEPGPKGRSTQTALSWMMKGHEDGGLMFFGKYEALAVARTRGSRPKPLSYHTLERR